MLDVHLFCDRENRSLGKGRRVVTHRKCNMQCQSIVDLMSLGLDGVLSRIVVLGQFESCACYFFSSFGSQATSLTKQAKLLAQLVRKK